jgi:hypothetical protein
MKTGNSGIRSIASPFFRTSHPAKLDMLAPEVIQDAPNMPNDKYESLAEDKTNQLILA